MGVTVSRDYVCDSCGADLPEKSVLRADLPRARGYDRRMVMRAGQLKDSLAAGTYCSLSCIHTAVDQLAATAATPR